MVFLWIDRDKTTGVKNTRRSSTFRAKALFYTNKYKSPHVTKNIPTKWIYIVKTKSTKKCKLQNILIHIQKTTTNTVQCTKSKIYETSIE